MSHVLTGKNFDGSSQVLEIGFSINSQNQKEGGKKVSEGALFIAIKEKKKGKVIFCFFNTW